MADMTTVSGTVVGVTAGGVSVVLGADGLVVLAAVLGALLAGAQSGRLEWTFRAVWVGVATFAASVVLGVAGGPFCSSLLVTMLSRVGADHVDVRGPDALIALFLGMYGVTVLLPALARRLGVEIETRRVDQ